MILLINLCKEKLHYYEFVKPIEDILKKGFFMKHISELIKSDFDIAEKVIICGTSLKQKNSFINKQLASFLREFNRPILGICAGMQLLVSLFGGKIIESSELLEIGFVDVFFNKEFLGFSKQIEVYGLHQLGVKPSDAVWEVYAKSLKSIQAVKHRDKEIYGVLFHPEVRQKDLISNFISI